MSNRPKTLVIGSVTVSEFEKLRKDFDTILAVKVKGNTISVSKKRLLVPPKGKESFRIAILVDESLEGLAHDLSVEWKRQGDELLSVLASQDKSTPLFKQRLDVAFKELKSYVDMYVDVAGFEPYGEDAVRSVIYVAESKDPKSIETREVSFTVHFKPGTAEFLNAEVDPTLATQRSRIADKKFEEFNFHGVKVQESDGWEYENPGRDYTKIVYIENGENPMGDSERLHFHVNFKSDTSLEVEEVYCLDAKTGAMVE